MREAHQKSGLPVVIVNPTGCFGPYELKPKSNCLIPQLVSGEIPATPNRLINVVDTKDVAVGHVLAAQKGRLGKRYILGGHNTTSWDVVQKICAVAKVKPPRFEAPLPVGLFLCALTEVAARLTGSTPRLPILGLRFIEYGQHFDLSRAQNELGYQAGPMVPCYEKAIAWYKKIGYC